ncbi:MAG: EcoKI restriction-modification system protein HsdS [Methanosaeta sp. PtaU1.Bin060]|nr:MAG: EcoKI restriction-modification system protein HsdS [Methanosaeta sp. PtaU1.Bin060]
MVKQLLDTVQLDLESFQKDGLHHVSIELNEIFRRGKRLDASFYAAEGRNARQIIAGCPYPKIPLFGDGGFAERAYNFRSDQFKKIFVKDGVPIYAASQILDFIPRSRSFIANPTKDLVESLELKKGQIVFTCSGTIGLCSVVSNILKGRIFSHDLIRIECHNSDDVGYVYAFLKTKIGKQLITTNNYGSVVTHIEPRHLAEIFIPNPPLNIKKEINENIATAFRLRDEAYELLASANDLLYKRLNLPPLKDLYVKYLTDDSDLRSFSLNINNWEHRLDASFHAPLIDKIVERLKAAPVELTTLGDKRVSERIILPGRFKRVPVEDEYGIPFLSGGDILQFDPERVKYISKTLHGKRIQEQLVLHKNMILITRSGTIGNTVLAPAHFDGWSASEDILRVVPSKESNAGYIYTFLASSYGSELVKRYTYGSVVVHIDDNQLSLVKFPLPSRYIQDEIGNPALEAIKKYTDAYKREKATILKLEDLIVSSSHRVIASSR